MTIFFDRFSDRKRKKNLWNFNGIPMEFWWNFYEIFKQFFMEFSWILLEDFQEIFTNF